MQCSMRIVKIVIIIYYKVVTNKENLVVTYCPGFTLYSNIIYFIETISLVILGHYIINNGKINGFSEC